MADHLVPGTDREALDVPVADQRLPRRRLGEPAVRAQRLDGPAELGGGRDVRADQAAGREHLRDPVDALPRREHVQDHPVDVLVRRALSTRSPTVSFHAGCRPSKNWSTFCAATSANSWRRS